MSDDAVEVDGELVTILRNAKAQAGKWQEIADTARRQLEQTLGEHDTGTVDGTPVVRWTHVKSNRLDVALVKASYPEVYATCQTVSTSRRFTLVDP